MSKRWITALIVLLFTIGFVRGRGVVVHSQWQADTIRGRGGDTIELTPTNLYIEAIKHLTIRRDSTAAELLLSQALELDSAYSPAQHRLAEIIIAKGEQERYPSALDLSRRAYLKDTTHKHYLMGYIRALVNNDLFSEALDAQRKLTKIDPHNIDNYRLQAILEREAGEDSLAVAILDSAKVLFGAYPELERMKHTMLLSMGHSQRVIAECRRAIGESPHEAKNYLYLGEVYAMLRQDSLATLCYKKAMEMEENNLEVLTLAGDYFINSANVEDYMSASRLIFAHPDMPLEQKCRIYSALVSNEPIYRTYHLQIWSLARTLNQYYPNSPEVVDIYTSYLIHSGDIEGALAHYHQHFGDSPHVLNYFLAASEIEVYLERYDQAISTLDRALPLFDNQRCELLLRKGHIKTLQDRYEEALECYDQAFDVAQTDSLRSIACSFKGDLHQVMAQGGLKSVDESYSLRDNGSGKGKWKRHTRECYKSYDQALKYNPDNASVLNNYAYFLSLEERDLERALTMATRATALAADNATYLDTHAWVLYKLGRYDEAKKILQRALSIVEQPSYDMQLHYGDILEALGEKFMAEVYWKRALENGADPKTIEWRIERIKGKTTTK